MLIREAKEPRSFPFFFYHLPSPYFSTGSIVVASNVFVTWSFSRATGRVARWRFYAGFYELEVHILNRGFWELQGLRSSSSSRVTRTRRIVTFIPLNVAATLFVRGWLIFPGLICLTGKFVLLKLDGSRRDTTSSISLDLEVVREFKLFAGNFI